MNIVIKEKLDNDYYIVQKVQKDGSVDEYTLVMMKLSFDDVVVEFKEYDSSRHLNKIYAAYRKRLNDTKVK